MAKEELTVPIANCKNETNYSRMDQVKFVGIMPSTNFTWSILDHLSQISVFHQPLFRLTLFQSTKSKIKMIKLIIDQLVY